MDFIAAVSVAACVYQEHRRSLRASAPLTFYLLATAFTDTTRSRSFFLREGLTIRGGLESATAGLKLCLVCLEEVSKRPDLIDADLGQALGLEATSGVLSRLLFIFLRPVFRRGYNSELLMEHISHLDPEFSPKLLYKQLKAQWCARKPNKKKHSRELFKACLRAWKQYILPMILARLSVTALNFAQPFLLREIIAMVGKPRDEPHGMAKRLGLLGGSACLYFGLPVARAAYKQLLNRYETRVRGGIISLLFDKVHYLPENEAKKTAAATLMEADVEGIISGIPVCLDIPFGIMEVGLGVYVLSRFIQLAAFTAFGPVVVFSVLTYYIGKALANRFAGWNKSIEERITKTAHILPQLTAIKMLGFGPAISTYLKALRVEEIEVSKSYRRFHALSIAPAFLADFMTPVVVIAAALFGSAFNGLMSAAKVFPILTVVSLIQTPLSSVLFAFPSITSMLACFSRIEAFLCSEERKDCRVHLNSTTSSGSSGSRLTSQESLVRFHQTDIAKKGMEEPLLRGVNFQLPPRSTTAVIGRTGSGKSALIDAILGKSEILGGSVEVDTSDIGYCGQDVCLWDASIRDNIVGLEDYDEERFNRAVRACFLEEDLNWLPGGADFVVGTNGCKLSGGQRQRVALARAAYRARKITVLDDVFSSLDRQTAICILHQLCGRNGLFEQAGCTVILVTYLSQCLDVCTHVVFLNKKRQARLSGKPEPGSPFAAVVMAVLNDSNINVRSAVENKEQTTIRRSLQLDSSSAEQQSNGLKRKGRLGIYRLIIDPIGRFYTFAYGILLCLFSAGEVLPEVYIRIWIELHPDQTLYFIGYISLILTACVLGCLCVLILHTKMSPKASISLHSNLVDKTVGATLGFMGATQTGHLLNLYSQDMRLVSNDLPSAAFSTLYAGAFSVMQIGVILSGASYLAIAFPFLLVIFYFVQNYYLRTSWQVRRIDLEMKTPLYTYFSESAAGLSHIQAFGWEKKNIRRGLTLLEQSQRPYYLMLTIQQWLGLVLGLISACLGVTLVALALFVPGGSSETSVGLSFIGLMSLSRTLEVTIIHWARLETSSSALTRLLEFDETTPQEVTVSRVELPERWPSNGQVEFREVTATYKTDSEDAVALDGITMSIGPGQRVGVAGRSGSGKSTLLLTLLGFVDYQGTVEIDGIDLAAISRHELRSRLVTISQDQVHFPGTIRMNLLPATINKVQRKSAADKEKIHQEDDALERLLKSLHIWTQLASKGGLDAILEDVGYSKGQIQLLCIARAIVKQQNTGSNVVLVDEATSSVDSATEKIVNRVMKEYFSGCTMISIGHRRSSLRHVQCIVEMYRGSIVGVEELRPGARPQPDSPDSDD